MAAAAPQPRLLTEEAAAAYLSLPLAEVRRMTIGRVRLGGKVRFDRLALDAHLDALSGLAPQSPPPAATAAADPDDPDAALDRFFGHPRHAPRAA